MKQPIFTFLFTVIFATANSQPYNFSQTQSAYADLSNETVLTTSAPWTYASAFTVPIGFTFNFMGSNFTTVYVEGSGFAYFDFNYYNLALPFTVKLKSKGSSGNNSPISYAITGSAPNRVCKIQWKNAGFHYDTTSTINFQMWLYETSNIVEVHMGANNVPNPSVVYQENGTDGPVIGVYEFNSPSNCTYSNCISGNPAAATVNNPTGNINLFGTALTGTPVPNTVYIFDPNPSSINEAAQSSFTVYPNPASDYVTIQSDNSVFECSLYSVSGVLMVQRKTTENRLDVSNLPNGIYFLETTNSGTISRLRFVISR